MSYRRVKGLSIAVKAMLAIAVLLAAIPFIGSLKPSERVSALDYAHPVDVSDFEPNTYRLIHVHPHETWDEGGSTIVRPGRAWIVIRGDDGEFRVFSVPTWDGSVLMPLRYWGQFEGFCEDLGPDRRAERIDEATQIVCNDAENDQYFRDLWYWSLDGENVSGRIADLRLLRSEHRTRTLMVLDSFWDLN